MPLMLVFSVSASDEHTDVQLVIPCQKQALANSMRCLETSDGDYERIARLRNWVASNLAYFGDGKGAIATLRGTKRQYHVPSGCVDAGTIFLGYGQKQAVRDLLSIALDELPYTLGHSPELIQFQILKLATAIDNASAVQRAWECEKLTGAKLKHSYQLFLKEWKPSIWRMILDRLSWKSGGKNFSKVITRDEEIALKGKQTADYFTCLLFIRAAESRLREKQQYPSLWIRSVEDAIRSPAFNTRPAGLSSELAKLACLERRPQDALLLVEQTWTLLGEWAPQMTGISRIEADLAMTLSVIPECQRMQDVAKKRIGKRSAIITQLLNPYELMIELPILAEASWYLGEREEAQKNWKLATDLCAQNQNPESQSAGLTRIWMSYARSNSWPTKETEERLQKIEKQLPAAYSKVNF